MNNIAPAIQLAIAPVFLLTAVGALIGVHTTRLGRAVDRSRVIEQRVAEAEADARAAILGELDVLQRRMRLIYLAITLDVVCGLFVGLTIVFAFNGGLDRGQLVRADSAPVRARDARVHREPRGVPSRDLPRRRAGLRRGRPAWAARQ